MGWRCGWDGDTGSGSWASRHVCAGQLCRDGQAPCKLRLFAFGSGAGNSLVLMVPETAGKARVSSSSPWLSPAVAFPNGHTGNAQMLKHRRGATQTQSGLLFPRGARSCSERPPRARAPQPSVLPKSPNPADSEGGSRPHLPQHGKRLRGQRACVSRRSERVRCSRRCLLEKKVEGLCLRPLPFLISYHRQLTR